MLPLARLRARNQLVEIRAADLRAIKAGPHDPGLLSYDPAFSNTAPCKSKITEIDGEKGTLHYRGYAIEELAAQSNFLETAYLIVKGELPDVHHFEMWKHNISVHTMVHENVKKFMDGFRYDAEPLGILIGTIQSGTIRIEDFEPAAPPVAVPDRIAALVARWICEGHARRAIFNLKLPMKRRADAVRDALIQRGSACDGTENHSSRRWMVMAKKPSSV